MEQTTGDRKGLRGDLYIAPSPVEEGKLVLGTRRVIRVERDQFLKQFEIIGLLGF